MERTVLTASEGMVYTDGVIGGKKVYLAEGQTADGWYEVAERDFTKAFESGVSPEEATESDYLAALSEFGVEV